MKLKDGVWAREMALNEWDMDRFRDVKVWIGIVGEHKLTAYSC